MIDFKCSKILLNDQQDRFETDSNKVSFRSPPQRNSSYTVKKYALAEKEMLKKHQLNTNNRMSQFMISGYNLTTNDRQEDNISPTQYQKYKQISQSDFKNRSHNFEYLKPNIGKYGKLTLSSSNKHTIMQNDNTVRTQVPKHLPYSKMPSEESADVSQNIKSHHHLNHSSNNMQKKQNRPFPTRVGRRTIPTQGIGLTNPKFTKSSKNTSSRRKVFYPAFGHGGDKSNQNMLGYLRKRGFKQQSQVSGERV